jgi:hypothetical protein
VAAALEVRGYGAAGRRPRARQAFSRHDLAFLAGACAMVGLAIAGRVAGLQPFRAYPALHLPVRPSELALAAALVACGLLPFADRRGIEA